MDHPMLSAPAAALPHAFPRADIDEPHCARCLPEAIRVRPASLPPLPIPRQPPAPLCLKARPSCPASPLRTLLPIRRRLPPPTRRFPLCRASQPLTCLPAHDESQAAATCLSPLISAPVDLLLAHPQPRPPPACAAQSAPQAPPRSNPLQAPQHRIAPGEPPPPRGTASLSNRLIPKWIFFSKNLLTG